MAQPASGDIFRSAASPESIGHAAAAAANANKPPQRDGRGGYSQQFSEFHGSHPEALRGLLPDPEKVNALGETTLRSQDPAKVELPSMSLPMRQAGGSGAPPGIPVPAANEASGAAALGSAPADAAAGLSFGSYPYPPSMGMPMAMPPAGWSPFGFDPVAMQQAQMQYMGMMNMMGMMPPMPGMMQPGMMNPSQGSGGGGQKGNKDQGGGKEKTRERRRRKNKNSKAAEEDPETEDTNRSDELNEVRKAGQTNRCQVTLQQVLDLRSPGDVPGLVEFAKDTNGSRWLQSKLEDAQCQEGERSRVIEILGPYIQDLSQDQFGNFVVQKLFDIGTNNQKRKLGELLQGKVLVLTKAAHGCRVIQKAFQFLPRDVQTQLAMELQDNVDECIKDLHGNHVIQKCIEQMPPESVDFIIKGVSDQVEQYAVHMYGCRVIQRLLEHCQPDQLENKDVLKKITKGTKELSENEFGNYVVQHMLEHGREVDKKKILTIVCEHIADFGKAKCSSNVVEKCFEICTTGCHADYLKEDRDKLFKTMLASRIAQGKHDTLLQELATDDFGNYIVQRMCEHSKGEERTDIGNQLSAIKVNLNHAAKGKHVIDTCKKELGINISLKEGTVDAQ
jgi:pumilio RNA-binding family